MGAVIYRNVCLLIYPSVQCGDSIQVSWYDCLNIDEDPQLGFHLILKVLHSIEVRALCRPVKW